MTNTQLDFEQKVIGGLLYNVEFISTTLSTNRLNLLNLFTSKELKVILSVILNTYTTYHSILTEPILVAYLKENNINEEEILQYKYLFNKLKKEKPNEAEFKYFFDKLFDSYISRCLVDATLQTTEYLQKSNNGKSSFELLQKNMLILEEQLRSREIHETSTKNILEEYLLYEDMEKNPEKYRGLKIGVEKLDEITGGFRGGELAIIIGATKVGKSLFLLNCQYNTAIQKYNSVFVTIEVSLEQARRRLASRVSEVPYWKIKTIKLDENEKLKLKTSLQNFQDNAGESLIIDVPQNCTAKLIEAKLRSLMKTKKIDLVILDYLLLMSPSIPSSKMNREERITTIALELKQLARNLSIPVITASQITADAGKNNHKNIDESYEWTDISQAKSIATHADWILSLKKEPDTNILNLGVTVGRDGALEHPISLIVDYSIMKLGNLVDSNFSTIPTPSSEEKITDIF